MLIWFWYQHCTFTCDPNFNMDQFWRYQYLI